MMYLLRSSKNHMSTPKPIKQYTLKNNYWPGYNTYNPNNRTAIIWKHQLDSKINRIRSSLSDTLHHWATAIHIRLSPTVGIIAISYYRPPNTNKHLVTQQFAQFQQFLQTLLDQYGSDTHILINGDFNMNNTHWYSLSTNYPGKRWFNMCKSLIPPLVCTNQNQYTYYDNKATKSPSILDYTFCDPSSAPTLKTGLPTTIHLPTGSLTTAISHMKLTYSGFTPTQLSPHWNWHRADWETCLEHLQHEIDHLNHQWDSHPPTTNRQLDQYNQLMADAMTAATQSGVPISNDRYVYNLANNPTINH